MYEDKLILFVDDDTNITTLYSSVFSHAGFNYQIAHNALQAEQLIKTKKPHLLLLDIMLPDKNGLEILREIKADPETQGIMVWMLSNLGDIDTRTKASELGASEYIIKAQFTPNQVVERIKQYLDNGS
ncbi:MAG TPA: response regulator [Candidatus Nanoarchaeia archaeon]|nr:transcriptional regulatory protein CusR [uncultured archaeon]